LLNTIAIIYDDSITLMFGGASRKSWYSEISSIYSFEANKKAPENSSDALMEDHLEKNTPLIIAEVRRLRHLLWDEYLEYKRQLRVVPRVVIPSSIHTTSSNV
jgi:hypothetical protein